MILLLLSFIAGILTILAPCTLPLLPVIVGSSIAGGTNMRKALTIASSLAVSIIAFTFILKVSTVFINIPQEAWQIVSGAIIIVFGLISLFPGLWERIPFVARMSVGSNKMLAVGYKRQGFWGDVIIGASLGPVFSTCSPTYFVILATVLPQSFLLGFIDLLAYSIGLSGMVLLIAFVGQRIVTRLGGVSDTHGWFKRTLGAIFVILGIIIIFGIDKQVEASILSSGFFDVTTIEQKLLSLNHSDSGVEGLNAPVPAGDSNVSDAAPGVLDGASASSTSNDGDCSTSTSGTCKPTGEMAAKSTTNGGSGSSGANAAPKAPLLHGPKAPEIVNPSGFINTDGQPITISQFKGKKVVLLDVWTYSCINCQRTLPYVKAWYDKYKDQGLEIIGLHTPEFAFEKVQSNVEAAVKKLGIEYPVVMDNDYSTWNAYGNQYWPRKYLINENGEIIYDHIGEGNYDVTERQIQAALTELNQAKQDGITVSGGLVDPSNAVALDESRVQSPETYFGPERNVYLANGTPSAAGVQQLTLPAESSMKENSLYLGGTWNFLGESAVSQSASKIVYKYNAKNVYMVASSDKPQTVTVLEDGVKVNTVTIQANTLYTLIQGTSYGSHTMEIDSDAPGLSAFTFTFG